MLKLNYFLTDFFILSAEKQPIKSSWRKIEWLQTIIVPKTLYQVTVTFGNKKIFFDPKDGKSAMSRTIDGVLEILKGRKDIRHQESVINDYLNQAQALVRRMESDGFIYTKNGHSGRSK